MKIFLFLILAISFNSFASDCYSQVSAEYAQITIDRNYEYDSVGKNAVSVNAFKRTWSNFNTEFTGENIEVFRATSEYMSGFGIDGLVVDRDTCKILEVVQVYAE